MDVQKYREEAEEGDVKIALVLLSAALATIARRHLAANILQVMFEMWEVIHLQSILHQSGRFPLWML